MHNPVDHPQKDDHYTDNFCGGRITIQSRTGNLVRFFYDRQPAAPHVSPLTIFNADYTLVEEVSHD